MKKNLREVTPRSARTVAPAPEQPVPAAGVVMSLDDLPAEDVRSQHLGESLERSVFPPPRREEEEAPKNAPPPAGTSAIAPAVVPKLTMKMIATPIDAELRRQVRELRGQYEVSESFVVETALRAFFADRPLADVAADLRARGGRLRRNRS